MNGEGMEFRHTSVLLKETIDALRVKPDGIYVDGTLGGGGHALEVCRLLSDKGRLIGIDQDGEAIIAAQNRLKEFKDRVTILRSNYCAMVTELNQLGITKADGILLDLGVSSHQLDDAGRGFAYREDAPLDMRMDTRQQLTAADVINAYSEEDLCRILREYGEERFARRIASQIVKRRSQHPIRTTGEFAELVRGAIPAKYRQTGGHPAKRSFQAVRIEVNRELEVLQDSLDGMIDLLADGGRLCVITFHSLEDRIVKQAFRRNENPCTCPPEIPVCVCGKKPKGRVISRKPVLPSAEELSLNHRAKSAKLRVFERVITEQLIRGAAEGSRGIWRRQQEG